MELESEKILRKWLPRQEQKKRAEEPGEAEAEDVKQEEHLFCSPLIVLFSSLFANFMMTGLKFDEAKIACDSTIGLTPTRPPSHI